jgi:very-short-patch-repair endonuclease
MKHYEARQVVIRRIRSGGLVLTVEEGVKAGVTRRQLADLAVEGVLYRAHPGVYVRAGDEADPLVRIRAGLAAAGAGAVASHRSAAWLQNLVGEPPATVEVTAIDGVHRRLRGVTVHRTRPPLVALPYRGVRCTAPARTLVDLAPMVSTPVLVSCIDRALVNGLAPMADLAAEASGRRRGCALLRWALAGLGHLEVPDASELEMRARRLFRSAQLPSPVVQVRAGPDSRYRIDCAWVESRLAVELYGFTYHHSPEQMAHDLSRQRELVLHGWTVLTFTWQEVVGRPERVVRDIRAALTTGAAGRRRSAAG